MTEPLDEKGLPDLNDVARWNAEAEAHALETLRTSQGLAAFPSPSMEMEVVAWLDPVPMGNGYRVAITERPLVDPEAWESLVTLSQAQSALAAMRAERDAASRAAQWHAFGSVLDFINTIEEKVVAKKEIYSAVMDMRPTTHDDIRVDLADFDTLGRHLREVNKAYEAAEAQVLRLTEENEALRKDVAACRAIQEIQRQKLNTGGHARAEAAEARIKALEEALTPSAATKAAHIGEFFERVEITNPMHEGNEDDEPETIVQSVPVSWTTIKEIMAAIRSSALKENAL